MTPNGPGWLLIANPENRRATMFQEALAEEGLPPALLLSWLDLLRDPERLARVPSERAIVRIESTGENADVEKELLRLGWADATQAGVSTIAPEEIATLGHDRGRILAPRQHHFGFLAALARMQAVFDARPHWRVLNPPADIATLFDKRETSRRYEALGVPVPPRLDGISTQADLLARMEEAGATSAFVKLSCGSSASCLAVAFARNGGLELQTTIEQAKTGWYNSLDVRRVSDPGRVAEIVGFLLREGSQIEVAVPKARLEGAFFDCRVLTVAGEPAFTVVRQSRHPITNLHLGGWRGDPSLLEKECPREVYAAAMESCRKVAASHPGSHQLGIDLMFEAGFTGHRVIEANAFGDLLPGLEREGRSVYRWEIAKALERC